MKSLLKFLSVFIISITIFDVVFALNNTTLQTSQTTNEFLVKRWKQEECPNGGTFEICMYSGDGNVCDKYLEKTRECFPSSGD